MSRASLRISPGREARRRLASRSNRSVVSPMGTEGRRLDEGTGAGAERTLGLRIISWSKLLLGERLLNTKAALRNTDSIPQYEYAAGAGSRRAAGSRRPLGSGPRTGCSACPNSIARRQMGSGGRYRHFSRHRYGRELRATMRSSRSGTPASSRLQFLSCPTTRAGGSISVFGVGAGRRRSRMTENSFPSFSYAGRTAALISSGDSAAAGYLRCADLRSFRRYLCQRIGSSSLANWVQTFFVFKYGWTSERAEFSERFRRTLELQNARGSALQKA
jgi:hypothetical protein